MDSDPKSLPVPSTMTPVKSKHMSLLITPSSPTQATSLPSPPYSPPPSATGRVSFQSDSATKALKVTRRQSSISYVSSRVNVYSRHMPSASTHTADPWTRTDIGSPWKNSFQVEDGPKRASRSVKRQTVGGLQDLHRLHEARAHVTTGGKAPLTLADKHADLLHAIAAAESKRLELQGQLATVEGELGELKRKWERIVNREPPHPTIVPSNLHASASVVDGLKEGVRLLAAGLSDLSDITSPIPAPAPATNTGERALDLRRHSQHQSDSSSTSTAYGRHSISSVSSVWEVDPPSIGGACAEDGELCLARNGHDDEVAKARQAKVFRRRSRDASHPPPAFTRHDTSCGSTTTGVDVVQGTSSLTMDTPIVAVGMSTTGVCGRDTDSLGYSGTPSKNAPRIKHLESAALPPPSSMPGVGSLSMVSEAWGTVGRKLGSDVFSKSQKRASVLLSDVSQSIASALSPGPVATTPAPAPSTSSLHTPSFGTSQQRSPSFSTASLRTPVSNASSPLARSICSISLRTPISKTLPRSGSWLEDDNEEMTTHTGNVMVPSVLEPTLAPRRINATTSSSFDDDDDDDWNW